MEFLGESIRGHSWERVKHGTDIYHAEKDWEGSMRLIGVGMWLGKVVSFMILYVDSKWLIDIWKKRSCLQYWIIYIQNLTQRHLL